MRRVPAIGANGHVTLMPSIAAAAALVLPLGVSAANDGLEANEADLPAARTFDSVGHGERRP